MGKEVLFDKVEKIKKPMRIFIFAGTLVVLAGLFVWFVYLPKAEEIKQTTEQIANLRQRLNTAIVKSRQLKKFEEEMAQVDIEFKEALKLLPNRKEIPSLLKNITQLGTDSRLRFHLFNPRNEKTNDFYVEIPVSIQVSGNYHDVAVFFDRVGGMERIVNILNVSIKPVKERSTTLTTSCDAVTYRFKGESNVRPKPKKK